MQLTTTTCGASAGRRNVHGYDGQARDLAGACMIDRRPDGSLWSYRRVRWFDANAQWKAFTRDPVLGELPLSLTPQRLDAASDDALERECARGARRPAVLLVPIALFDPARLAEIEAAAVEYGVAFSRRDDDLQARRDRRIERLGLPGTPGHARRAATHPARRLRAPDGTDVLVDEGIWQAVEQLWRAGVATSASCQGTTRHGGLYVCGQGSLPTAIACAAARAGLHHHQGAADWIFSDLGPRVARPAFHAAAKALLDDVASGGLAAVDASGQRYLPRLEPLPTLSAWLRGVRRRCAQRRARLALAWASGAPRDRGQLLAAAVAADAAPG